jgi:hypothetical protein
LPDRSGRSSRPAPGSCRSPGPDAPFPSCLRVRLKRFAFLPFLVSSNSSPINTAPKSDSHPLPPVSRGHVTVIVRSDCHTRTRWTNKDQVLPSSDAPNSAISPTRAGHASCSGHQSLRRSVGRP